MSVSATQPAPVYIHADLAVQRREDGGVDILGMGSNGASRWYVLRSFTESQWIDAVANMSFFRVDPRERAMAILAATHLHRGRHQ